MIWQKIESVPFEIERKAYTKNLMSQDVKDQMIWYLYNIIYFF